MFARKQNTAVFSQIFIKQKCIDGWKFLIETLDIIVACIIFLRKIHNIRQESSIQHIIYLDWIKHGQIKTIQRFYESKKA